MSSTIELHIDEQDINIEKFWELVDDLLYTKVFFDADTNVYFTKRLKTCGNQETGEGSPSQIDDVNDDDDDDDDELDLCTEEDINTLLVSYIALVAKYYDHLALCMGEAKFLDSVAEYLLEFRYYQSHVEFCIRKMLSLLNYSTDLNLHNLGLEVDSLDEEVKAEVNESIDTNEKFIKIIGWIFFKHFTKFKKELLSSFNEFSGFTVLSKAIKNYVAISKTVQNHIDLFGEGYQIYMRLLFELCKHYQYPNELDVVDPDDIVFIFESLKVLSRAESEVNFWKFRVLLILNEQYMYRCGVMIHTEDGVNYVLDSMLKNIKYFQAFNEILVLNFNRGTDVVDQILMMKFLYVVFSNEISNSLVYLNDIKIIVDIIIRQLFDLQSSNYDYLVCIYLRVLRCIMTKTDLVDHNYKKNDLKEVLNYICTNEDSSEKVRRLAQKCIQCDYLNQPNNSTATLPIDLVSKNADLGVQMLSKEKSSSLPDLTNRSHSKRQEEHSYTRDGRGTGGVTGIFRKHIARSPTGRHIISPHRAVSHLQEKGILPGIHIHNLSSSNPSKHSKAPPQPSPPPPPPSRSHYNIATEFSRRGSESSEVSSIGSDKPIVPPPRPISINSSLKVSDLSIDDVSCHPKKDRTLLPPSAPPRYGRLLSYANQEISTSVSKLALDPLKEGTTVHSTQHRLPPPPPPPPPSRTSKSYHCHHENASDPEITYMSHGEPQQRNLVASTGSLALSVASISTASSNGSSTMSKNNIRRKKGPPPPPPVSS
jgi:hypothetical protein